MQKAILFWRNRKSFGSASLAFSPEQILKWNGSGIALSNDKLAAQQPRAELFSAQILFYNTKDTAVHLIGPPFLEVWKLGILDQDSNKRSHLDFLLNSWILRNT